MPAYPMADGPGRIITLQRVVVKVGLSHDLAYQLLLAIKAELTFLEALETPLPDMGKRSTFHH